MKDKEIKALFEQAGSIISDTEEGKKAASLLLLKQEAGKQKVRPAAGWFELLRLQLRFLDSRIFLAQLLLITVVVLFLKLAESSSGEVAAEVYFAWGSGLAALLGIFVTAGYKRMVSAGLSELAESCCFNVKQNCIFSMMIYGGIDLMLLFLFLLFTGRSTQRSLVEIGIYLFLPFLLSNCLYLFLLLLGKAGKSSLAIGGSSMLLAVLLVSLMAVPDIYEKAACIIWYICGGIGMAVFAAELKLFFLKVKEGDILCTN